jgi:acylphosphatase
MENRRISVIVRGRVQGVNFRWYTRQRVMQLGIVGWVRNRRGGIV